MFVPDFFGLSSPAAIRSNASRLDFDVCTSRAICCFFFGIYPRTINLLCAPPWQYHVFAT